MLHQLPLRCRTPRGDLVSPTLFSPTHPFLSCVAHPFSTYPTFPLLPRALFSPTQPPSPDASYQSHERFSLYRFSLYRFSLYRFSLYRFSLYRRSLDRMPRTRPQGGIVRSSHFGICTNGEFSECANYFLPRRRLNYFLRRRSLTPSLGASLTRCALSIARRVQVVHDARHACDNLPRRTCTERGPNRTSSRRLDARFGGVFLSRTHFPHMSHSHFPSISQAFILRYFISLTNPVFPICHTQFFVYLAVFFVLGLAA